MEKKRQNSRRFYCVVAVESCHAHQQQQQLKYLPFFTCLDCQEFECWFSADGTFLCVSKFSEENSILNGTARAQFFNGFSSFWKPYADLNPPPKKKKKGKREIIIQFWWLSFWMGLTGRMGMAGGWRCFSGPGADDRPAAGLWSHGRSNRPPFLPSRLERSSFFTPHGSRSVRQKVIFFDNSTTSNV